MEINVDKSNIVRISKEPAPVQIATDQKQLKNVQYLNLGTSESRLEIPEKLLNTVKNEVLLHSVMEEKNMLHTRKANWIGHPCVGTAF